MRSGIEKNWIWVALAIIAIGLISVKPWRKDTIQWQSQLSTAKQLAQAQNKPILVDFSSESCVPCRRMDGDTFADRDVEAAVSSGFIPVRLDGARDIADLKAFHVFGIPTVVILDPNGKEIIRSEGYTSSDQFLKLLKATKVS